MVAVSTVSATVHIDMPRPESWKLLRDLSIAHKYVPGIIKTEISTELKEGIGTSRKVYQTESNAIDETVEEWNEGFGFTIRLHRGHRGPPLPFKEARFRYAIDDQGTRTTLTTSLSYVMRWGRTGHLLDRLLINRIIDGRIRKVAQQMKIYYESTQNVTPR